MAGSCGNCEGGWWELSRCNRQKDLLPEDGAESQCHRDAGITWLRLAEARG